MKYTFFIHMFRKHLSFYFCEIEGKTKISIAMESKSWMKFDSSINISRQH